MSDFPRLANEISERDAELISKAIASQDVSPDASVLSDCVSVTIENGKACLNLPFGLGRKCIDVPDWIPDGTGARACVSVRKRYGIPVGIRVCVYVVIDGKDVEVACADFGI